MKTEDLQAQGLSEEQIKFVMAENGKDINREKNRADGYKTQLDSRFAEYGVPPKSNANYLISLAKNITL